LCDSYEGLPEYVKLNTLKELGRDLRVFPNKIYPYHYPSVVPPNNDKYAFAHIDTGTNDGLKDVVYDLIPRMADGGIVAMGGVNESMLRTLKINIEVIELKNCGIVYHVVKR